MLSQIIKTWDITTLADWWTRFCLALAGDGAGNGSILVKDGSPQGQATLSQALFDAISADKTTDDFFFQSLTTAAANPSIPVRLTRNCGRTLATMGRLADLLPYATSRSVVTLTTPSSPYNLLVNKIYNLTSASGTPIFVLPGSASTGDQIDFTTEGNSGTMAFEINDGPNFITLDFSGITSAAPVYCTFVWTGTRWETIQSG